MIHYTGDLNADINNYLEDQAKLIRGRPVCALCGEPIQGEWTVPIDDKRYCVPCLVEAAVPTEDLCDG